MEQSSRKVLQIMPTENVRDETCRTFILNGEDHTLGNSLRHVIMKNPDVEFCGYSVPHPSENRINMRIQTKGVPAADVFRRGLEELSTLCEHILATFEESVESYKKEEAMDET